MLTLPRSFWFRIVAYILIVFPIAFTWHLVIFRDYYTQLSIFRQNPIIPLGFATTIIQAVVLSLAYEGARFTASPIKNGLCFGFLVAALMGSYGVIAEGAKYQIDPLGQWFLHEGAFFLLQYLLVGAIFGLISGHTKTS